MDGAVTIGRNDEVRIAGMNGVWVVSEVRGDRAYCIRLYTRMRDWFPLADLTVEVAS